MWYRWQQKLVTWFRDIFRGYAGEIAFTLLRHLTFCWISRHPMIVWRCTIAHNYPSVPKKKSTVAHLSHNLIMWCHVKHAKIITHYAYRFKSPKHKRELYYFNFFNTTIQLTAVWHGISLCFIKILLIFLFIFCLLTPLYIYYRR